MTDPDQSLIDNLADAELVALGIGHHHIVLGEVELFQLLLPGGGWSRRGFVLIPRRQLPELRELRRVRAVERQVDPEHHAGPPQSSIAW